MGTPRPAKESLLFDIGSLLAVAGAAEALVGGIAVLNHATSFILLVGAPLWLAAAPLMLYAVRSGGTGPAPTGPCSQTGTQVTGSAIEADMDELDPADERRRESRPAPD